MSCGVCIYTYHASGYVFIWNQVTMSASYMIKYKVQLERDDFNIVLVVQAYHTDKIVFTAEKIIKKFIEYNQTMEFSGIGETN